MKRPEGIEVKMLTMELAYANAKIAVLEERLAESVPFEQYEAVEREKESLEAQIAYGEKLHREEMENLESEHRKEKESLRREYEEQLSRRDAEIAALKTCNKGAEEIRAMLEAENVDCKALIEFWQSRQFGRSSETMVEEMDRLVGKLPGDKAAFMADTMAMINSINQTHGQPCPKAEGAEGTESQPSESPMRDKKKRKAWRKRFKCSDIREIFGIDFGDLAPGSKIAMRTVNGEKREEVTNIEVVHYLPARFYSEVFQVANCNVPGEYGTRQTRRPQLLFGNIAVAPSFARFYLEMKFQYNRSEGQIINYMRKLGCRVDQATLNRWMHAVIEGLMERLLPAMEDEIRQSRFTHNDETRILVRVLDEEKDKLEYRVKYMHGILSPAKRLFMMLYKEGSRSHEVQMGLFDGSMIEAFTADRCEIYKALQKEFETPPIRGACWVHFRRYLLNAFHQDERLEPAVQLLARLFHAENLISRSKKLTETERVRERQGMCKPLTEAIFTFMQRVRDAGTEYGTLAQRAASYLLDDREGFCAFLDNGLLEISNNAIERCFRRLALGRRNWLQCGSHKAAEHTAFMYSLVECCEMNDIDFGEYVEYILQEIKGGNTNYRSLLPNRVNMPQKEKAPKVA